MLAAYRYALRWHQISAPCVWAPAAPITTKIAKIGRSTPVFISSHDWLPHATVQVTIGLFPLRIRTVSNHFIAFFHIPVNSIRNQCFKNVFFLLCLIGLRVSIWIFLTSKSCTKAHTCVRIFSSIGQQFARIGFETLDWLNTLFPRKHNAYLFVFYGFIFSQLHSRFNLIWFFDRFFLATRFCFLHDSYNFISNNLTTSLTITIKKHSPLRSNF